MADRPLVEATIDLINEDAYTFNGERNLIGPDMSQVEKVLVGITSSFISFSTEGFEGFCNLFQHAPKLRHLNIAGARQTLDIETLVQIIEAVIVIPSNFKILELYFLSLTGTNVTWNNLQHCVQTCFPSLEEIAIDYDVAIDSNPHYFEPTIQALLTIPTLRNFHFGVQDFYLTPATLQRVCRCQNLTKLRVSHLFMEDDHIMALSNALQSNTQLELLLIKVASNLKTPVDCGKALASVLRGNTSLQKLDLRGKNWEMQELFLLEVLEGMRSNSSITDFQLWTSRLYPVTSIHLSKPAQKALENMMKDNFTLERFFNGLSVTSRAGETERTVEHYLGLNKAGRARLLGGRSHGQNTQQASLEEWMSAIIAVRSCAKSIFYFLSHNPQLLCNMRNEEILATESNGAKRPFSAVDTVS
jgi:hypothetical protein